MSNNILEEFNNKMRDENAEADILALLISGTNSNVTPIEQADIMASVKREHFSNLVNFELFDFMTEIFNSNRDLSKEGIKSVISLRGSNGRIKTLKDEVDRLSQFRVMESYGSLIERMKEVYKTRSFYNDVLVKGNALFSRNEPIDSLIEQISDSLMNIDSGRTKVELKTEAINVVNRLLDKQSAVKGLMTGLEEFDKETGGIKPDRYYTIGAESGAGKTAILIDFIERLASQHNDKIAILFFSMEMSEERIIQRLISRKTGLTNQRLEERGKSLNPSERTAISQAGKAISKYNLEIIYDVMNIPQMELAVRRFALQNKGKHLMIMLDHIGLVQGRTNDMRVNTINASSMMKGFCTKYKSSCFVLTQFTKEIDSKENTKTYHRPHMGYIMESGRIRQDSDVVILLWRPETRFVHIRYKGDDQWKTAYRIVFLYEKIRDGFAPFDSIYYCDIGANLVRNLEAFEM